MPAFSNSTPGAPVWIDLSTTDRDGAIAFYNALFGWDIDDEGFAQTGYTYFLNDGKRVAGLIEMNAVHKHDVWNVYLATQNADVVASRVAEAGGDLLTTMVLGGTGAVLHITDPDGAWIGGWQTGTHAGFDVVAEPGAPGWFELRTLDYDAALRFYAEAFDWKPQVMSNDAQFRYSTLNGPAGPLAGVWDASGSGEAASRWTVYFIVESTDAAILAANEAGGTLLQPAKESPFGRMAEVADPQGAAFFVIEDQPRS